MPSYTDQLYGIMHNDYELYHHGILGQKWGVRRYQNTDGTLTAAGKKRYDIGSGNTSNIARLKNSSAIGSSKRVREKQQMFNAKIKKSGDSNALVRNLINDPRRGKVAALDLKARHREAKEAYKKDPSAENLKALREARIERLIKNSLGPDATSRGTYNRYRSEGKSKLESVLKTSGKKLAFDLGFMLPNAVNVYNQVQELQG